MNSAHDTNDGIITKEITNERDTVDETGYTRRDGKNLDLRKLETGLEVKDLLSLFCDSIVPKFQ